MKTKLLSFLLILFYVTFHFSQEVPLIKVGNQTISVKKLEVEVAIFGDIAITTYDMQFYNPKNTVLEGELSFPLEENQSVTRFALDINGNLREAVVVEREKARVAFENTVRNRIDPALLEQTKGNNYKARVYPIPAKGYKRVVVSFQQKLLLNNDFYYFKMPFKFKNKLDEFSLSIKVFNQKNKPVSTNGMLSEFSYDSEKDVYYTKVNKVKAEVSKPVLIKIPLNYDKEKLLTQNDYFYFTKQLNNTPKKVALENEITIFWDKSLSQKNKKIETEMSFLDAYFNKNKEVKVRFVVFNTEVRSKQEFVINNGNWNSLKTTIESIIYDGASSFRFLSTYKTETPLNFFFSDGLNTLSDLDFKFKKKTHIVNSSSSANHTILKHLANISGGKYINLQQKSVKAAIKEVYEAQLQFLGTNILSDELEVYPKKGSIINNNFSISGKGDFFNKKIKFFFGYDNDTIKTISFFVKNKNVKNNFISKIWAQKKLNYLVVNSEKNRSEIIKLSKKHQIISPFTSMLILDRVEDYVAHSIEPPKELKQKYDELTARKINNKKDRIARLQNQLFNEYENFFTWYDKDYKSIKRNEIVSVRVNDTTTLVHNDAIENSNADEESLIRGEFFVSGIVKSESDSFPLPGVNVLVKGKTRGKQTDFDGKYRIKVKIGDVLVYSYLGFTSAETTINSNRSVNIDLVEDVAALDEIIVVGYGTSNSASRRLNRRASRRMVKSEIISNALQGSVSGVQIQNNTNDSNVIVSGTSSIKESKSLFVVDGKLVENNPNLESKEIQSLYVLKSEQSEQLYGSRGSDGVVVIVTKKGFNDNLEAIKDFEEQVKEKLELKGWNPKTPYLKVLKKIKNIEVAYLKYIELREKYSTSPSFYIDVADYFKERGATKIAIQVLTNVAEIDLDNYELLKALAYKFEAYELYDYAVSIYKEILKLRPEDIQSYRDLALVYEASGEFQKSVDLLYKIVNGELLEKDENRRFSGIESIALNELNRMVSLYKTKISISHIDKNLLKTTKLDIRVLIDWNHNDTDIDLWVIDPKKEKCFYKHTKTKIGGLMSKDMTRGFGPEQFVLKNGVKGNYKIKVKYYASSQQKISGPTFLKITTFKNYGSKNEIKNVKLLRLAEVNEVIDVGEFVF